MQPPTTPQLQRGTVSPFMDRIEKAIKNGSDLVSSFLNRHREMGCCTAEDAVEEDYRRCNAQHLKSSEHEKVWSAQVFSTHVINPETLPVSHCRCNTPTFYMPLSSSELWIGKKREIGSFLLSWLFEPAWSTALSFPWLQYFSPVFTHAVQTAHSAFPLWAAELLIQRI